MLDSSSEPRLSEAVEEIIRLADVIRESKLLDLLKLSEEVKKLKEQVHFMRYKPWEWFKRDETFYRALMNEIDKRVAKEVEQGLMFTLYEERPGKVVEMVKRVVEDYLKKWEVDDQIAEQIVKNVIVKPEVLDHVLRVIVPNIVRAVLNRMNKQFSASQEVLRMLEEEYDVLEKEKRG